MPTPNHPDDELLSALAGGDAEARADAALASHVAECARCADLVTELGALRASLADLPDLAPSRPLRLLPPVDDHAPAGTDRLGRWVRRLFAPMLTVGATLALVGVVGTAAPGMGGQAASAPDEAAQRLEAATAGAGAAEGGEAVPDDVRALEGSAAPAADGETFGFDERDGTEAEDADALPAERSPWPMVLFSGAAVVVGALLLRWIVVPRAG